MAQIKFTDAQKAMTHAEELGNKGKTIQSLHGEITLLLSQLESNWTSDTEDIATLKSELTKALRKIEVIYTWMAPFAGTVYDDARSQLNTANN